eukprot:COSAG01_NODE_47351_length_391_cov_0.866438_2_plen_43_part_01
MCVTPHVVGVSPVGPESIGFPEVGILTTLMLAGGGNQHKALEM